MTPWWAATRSTMWCRASSMPRPSRSNLTSPTAAQSSLSHCRTVRPGIRAHSTGQTSTTGRSQMTMPPEWMPRCRGKPSSCAGQVAAPAAAVLARRASAGRGRPSRPSPRPRLGGVPEGLADVAEGRAGPVGDDVGHLGRVQPAVALVDVLDDLLAPARLDVDVDVGGPVAGRGQEPLEEQSERHGVDVGDARGRSRRPRWRPSRGPGRRCPCAGRTGRCPTR